MASPSLPFDPTDGRWLAHRYVEDRDDLRFRWFPRDRHRAITFLSDEEVGPGDAHDLSRADFLATAQGHPLPPPSMILHSAFCCSTLLLRSLDLPGIASGYSEPVVLNDIAGLALRRGDPRQVAAAMDAALHALARPLQPGERSVVKPSNVVNALAPLMLALRPDMRLLLLYAPLPTFVASIARKEIEGRLWVRELFWKLMRLGLVSRFELGEEELFRLTDLQVAALSWLAQHALFADLAARHPANVRTLGSDRLMATPAAALAALGSHFGLAFDADEVAASPAFTSHSKDGRPFDSAARAEEEAKGAALHAREIEIVLRWTERTAEHAGIDMKLPQPLLN
jgi:hypothetical protein